MCSVVWCNASLISGNRLMKFWCWSCTIHNNINNNKKKQRSRLASLTDWRRKKTRIICVIHENKLNSKLFCAAWDPFFKTHLIKCRQTWVKKWLNSSFYRYFFDDREKNTKFSSQRFFWSKKKQLRSERL